MDNPAITYDELKAALEEDSCERITEPALFALLDKLDQAPSLLGRWATHPDYGRGIIASDKPDTFKEVRFTIRNDEFTDGADQLFVRFDDLTLDPVTLNTTEEFENAPEGTIVETGDMRICHKVKKNAWLRNGSETAYTHLGMTSLAECIPSRVIRWGDGK